jgi:ATP-dependent Zn protease
MSKKTKSRQRKQSKQKTRQSAVITSSAKAENLNEEHDLDEMMNETVPRRPLKQKWVTFALFGVIILLGIVLFVMYEQTSNLRQNTTNTGQDQLLNIKDSGNDSLAPTGAADAVK